MQTGKLIVIEGGDSAGKATQAGRLRERLLAEGHEVETLDFPQYDSNTFGQLLRECLSGERGDFMNLDPRITSTLYAADRFESKKLIDSWLQAGKIVVLDRYTTSNMLHQGAKSGSEEELTELLDWIQQIEYEVFGVPRPDTVVYLDVPAEVRLEVSAKRQRGNVAERHRAHQFAADAAGKAIAAAYGWTTIACMKDGALRSIEDIHEEVYHQVTELIQT